MAWQESVSRALRGLEKQAATLEAELATVREVIRDLERIAGRAPRSGPQRLSEAGRAAISRAAKKRWAAYRKAQKARCS